MATKFYGKHWSFTWFSVPDVPEEYFGRDRRDEWDADFYCCQVEAAPDTGRFHIQGYIAFRKKTRLSGLQKLFVGCHGEGCKGTPAENIKYCTKEESRVEGPWQVGEVPSGMGTRTDIERAGDLLAKGKRVRDLVHDESLRSVVIKYHKGLEYVEKALESPIDRQDIKVTLHYGPPGSGKTFCAKRNEDKSLKKGVYDLEIAKGSEFLIGYKGQETIVMDEFTGAVCRPQYFNKLIDEYPLEVNVKGGVEQFRGKDIHITSNFLPNEWWSQDTNFVLMACYRRIHEVHWHSKRGTCHRFVAEGDKTAMEMFLDFYKINNF